MKRSNFHKIGIMILSVLLSLAILSTTAFSQENIISEPIEIPSEAQLYSDDEDTLDVDSNVNVQVANENNLKVMEDIYLTQSDLQKKGISVAKSSFGANRSGDLTFINANDLMAENEINFSAKNKNMARAATSNGFYMTITDYLTVEGSAKYIYPITIANGQILQIQCDMPNSTQIDYNLYLFEVDAVGNMTLVDYSEYATLINGTSGTLPEAVGAYNTSGVSKDYAVFVQSYMGASINQGFTAHIAINNNSDKFETDENPNQAIPFTLTSGNTVINLRSMDTLADNDWYMFTVPSNKNYSRATFALDSDSNAAGYKIEVYTKTSGGMKKEVVSSNKVNLSSGVTYYVRVTAVGASTLTSTNYTMTISPEYTANQVIITEFGGGDRTTYYNVNCYRVNGSSTLTVKGQAGYNGYIVPNATVTVTVQNDNWNPTDLRYKTATVTTDSNGYFTAKIVTSPSTASQSYYIYGAMNFIHYYDIGCVYAQSGSATSEVIPIYIFAYSY